MNMLLFIAFFALMIAGVPLGVSMGLSATALVALTDLGIMSVPTSVYTGIAKYPLLAIPVFVLAGMVFERSGVALRLVRFAVAIVGDRRGGLALGPSWCAWCSAEFPDPDRRMPPPSPP